MAKIKTCDLVIRTVRNEEGRVIILKIINQIDSFIVLLINKFIIYNICWLLK